MEGKSMCRLTIAILHGHRQALVLGLPWHVDVVATVMRKIQQLAGIGSVENGLKDVACGITNIDAGQSYALGESSQLEEVQQAIF